MIRNAYRVLLVLWVGSLWSLALWVAPTLFFAQPDRHLAGLLAARLFAVETYLGMAVAALGVALPGRGRQWAVYGAVALLAINEWILKSLMEEAHAQGAALGLSFGAWHGVSAVGYLIGCLLVLWGIWRQPL
ncbi:MAG: DUF4149 domain-containing protein [Steroidobacteraceae bacterium]